MKNKQRPFTAEATYYNVSANSLFVAFVALLLTYYSWQKNGWSLLTKSVFIISGVFFIITVILFFSKWSSRRLIIDGNTLSVGRRSFQVDEIHKIECIAIGRVLHIYIKNIDESLTLRLREQYRIPTRQFVQKWCQRNEITFIDK